MGWHRFLRFLGLSVGAWIEDLGSEGSRKDCKGVSNDWEHIWLFCSQILRILCIYSEVLSNEEYAISFYGLACFGKCIGFLEEKKREWNVSLGFIMLQKVQYRQACQFDWCHWGIFLEPGLYSGESIFMPGSGIVIGTSSCKPQIRLANLNTGLKPFHFKLLGFTWALLSM